MGGGKEGRRGRGEKGRREGGYGGKEGRREGGKEGRRGGGEERKGNGGRQGGTLSTSAGETALGSEVLSLPDFLGEFVPGSRRAPRLGLGEAILTYMRNLLCRPETRLAQMTLDCLKVA